MKTKLLLTAFLLTLTSFITSNAQAPHWQWAISAGGPGGDNAARITTDRWGNVYTTGNFSYTADFDPSASVYNLTAITGATDMFISKTDSAGNFIWAKAISCKNINSLTEPYAIVADTSGNIYTSGLFFGKVDFNPGSDSSNYNSYLGGNDIFILKLDSAGNFVWVKRIGATNYEESFALALDADNNIYYTGDFDATTDFDPDTNVVYNLTGGGAFVSKLDSAGKFIWAKRFGAFSGRGIAIDNLFNVYSTGMFEATVDFDPNAGTANLVSAGMRDIYVSKLDSAGNYIWAKRMGGSNLDDVSAIALDDSANIYTAGNFSGLADFNPGSAFAYLSSLGTNSDIFVSKLDSSGNYRWANRTGGTDYSWLTNMVLDNKGNSYITGGFGGTIDFDPGAGTYNLVSGGSSDPFVRKLTGNGSFVWVKSQQGINEDVANAATIDVAGNLIVAGYYYSASIAFDATTLGNSSALGTSGDIFIAKLDTLLTTGISTTSNPYQTVSVFPNPFTNEIVITNQESGINIGEVVLYDVTGKEILRQTISSEETVINTSKIAAGFYFLNVDGKNFKVVKN